MTRRRRDNFWTLLAEPIRWFRTDQTDWVATRSNDALTYWVALAAAAGVFFELAVIRWHSALFSLFGFYKNFSLLSAFLGLGIGYAVGKRNPIRLGYVVLFLCAQLALFGLVKYLGWHHMLKNPVSEQLTMGLETTGSWQAWFGVVAFLALVYVLNALTFVPLGQVCSALMARLPNLKAYGANLLGSVAGIGTFTLLSYWWMPPEIWFAVGLSALLVMISTSAVASPMLTVACVLFSIFCVYEPRPLRKQVFSPYQALSIRPVNDDARVVVSVNQLYYQKILDLSRNNVQRNPTAQLNAMGYDMPFQLTPHPESVLIVGSGTGNDVAAALRRGAGHVDAVEIDPAIQKIGAELHPEKPYQDARVSVFIDDARSFMKKTTRKYDLIVYGLLDSHTMLSSLSNVRLDSFVYTVEAFKEARTKLKDSGMLGLSFSMISDGLGHKLFRMLKEAFGEQPIVLQPGYDGGVLFLVGGGTKRITASSLPLPNLASRYANYSGPVDLSTDDWPFFYMPLRRYPVSYAGILAVILLLSMGLIRSLVPIERRAGVAASSWIFFFLGAGFMLIETRAITELGLTFGNTWFVVAAVVSGILFMAWAANWTASRLPDFPASFSFFCLAAALVFGWWAQGRGLAPLQNPAVALGVAVLPLFFSGLLFSSMLREQSSTAAPMAANLFGSICGGLLEYHSMVAGFRSLYLLGLAMYGASFAIHFWQKRARQGFGRSSGRATLRKVASSR